MKNQQRSVGRKSKKKEEDLSSIQEKLEAAQDESLPVKVINKDGCFVCAQVGEEEILSEKEVDTLVTTEDNSIVVRVANEKPLTAADEERLSRETTKANEERARVASIKTRPMLVNGMIVIVSEEEDWQDPLEILDGKK